MAALTAGETEALLAPSEYAKRALFAEPRLAAEIAALAEYPLTRAGVDTLFGTAPTDETALSQRLRWLRKRVLLSVMLRDLAALADLEEVMRSMTLFAEAVIDYALPLLAAAQSDQGLPQKADGSGPMPLVVIAMGKFGSGELNVSSDIDVIYAYPEDGEIAARRLSHFEFFARLAKKLTQLLSEPTGDGFVFRVDTRLRPYGDSGPLVSSFAMLENYYALQGREWERYAWIKGRVVHGREFEAELLGMLKPFVFRRYLDFGALAGLRALHAQIRSEVARRELHDDIKRGPGGIREIEFIAQVFQLIRGGRDPALQQKPTLTILPLLAERGLISAELARDLCAAYDFLRRLEHRIQYREDQQTHSLPSDEAARAAVARMMAYEDYAQLETDLRRHRNAVTRAFESVFAKQNRPQHPLDAAWLAGNVDTLHDQLQTRGYDKSIAERLASVRTGTRYAHLPDSSRRRFDQLIPQLIELAAAFDNKDETFARGLDLFEAIGGRESYLALLHEYPNVLERVLRLCSASAWAADYLKRHPLLLDELISGADLEEPTDWQRAQQTIEMTLKNHDGDIEQQLDSLRHFKNAIVFRLLIRDINGALSVETLGDELSALADMLLGIVLQQCWRYSREKHLAHPRVAIIAYGKLGGKELGYASDLDIIFIYDDDSDAAYTYAKLAQRVNTWLGQTTAAGVLYETDLRLRPDGASGLLVTSVEAFEDYQKNKAWIWEHQALTRARWCAGDESIREKFDRIRADILSRERDPVELRHAISEMREKIHAAHPNTSALFDIKHDRGGILDIEFAVQYLVLLHAREHAELLENRGNIHLLKLAERLKLLPGGVGERAADAYREFRRLQHAQRLRGERYARVAPERVEDQRGSALVLWDICIEAPKNTVLQQSAP